MNKPKLLISFSGGATSAFMTQWCLNHWKDKYDMEVVFANTGEEREETLEFVRKCDEILDFNTTWVECVVHMNERRSCTHRVVDFESASRNGQPFEEMMKKYGIPNMAYPHCTRELKTNPIKSYVKNELGWDDFYTAIGIRIDEVDRIDEHFEEKKYLYPLCQDIPTTKQEVNNYWLQMPFRLELKGYQGNCKVCWKKSLRKLLTIASESPDDFDNFEKWEKEFENYTPSGRNENNPPYRFYRDSLTVDDIKGMADKGHFKPATDDSLDTAWQARLFGHELDTPSGCSESCEPF